MRISRLFIKHRSQSQLFRVPAECAAADAVLSLKKGQERDPQKNISFIYLFVLGKKNTNEAGILLKPVCLKASLLKKEKIKKSESKRHHL